MSDSYRTQSAAEYGDVRPSEQVTMLDFSGDFLRQAEQSMDDSGTERHGSLEPDDSRNVTGANAGSGGGAIRQPGGADQQQGGERWGSDDADGAQSSQTEPGVRQSGEPFSAQEAAGEPEQDRSAGTAQVELDAENAGAGQEIQFEDQGALGGAGQHTQFDPGQQQQGGGSDTSGIREHMEVIGADGVHLGTVDKVEGAEGSRRIKLTKADSASGHQDHHHYISCGLVAGVEGDKVRLSATAANAYGMEEEE